MLSCQKELFSLEPGWHYLNCAYMSPLLKSVEEAGIAGLLKKRNPFRIRPIDFFEEAEEVRALFGKLVGADGNRIALIPSASYGMGIVRENIKRRKNGRVITVQDEFPSDVYALQRICEEQQMTLHTIQSPVNSEQRARDWNRLILESIDENTALVNLSSVHWSDGTIFDLEAIGEKAHQVDAAFVVDGAQSVGAVPIDVQKCRLSALICPGYKWLMSPYTSGFAYFGEYFDNGKPIEESWLNRKNSEDFKSLVSYQSEYRPLAARYNMGEYSNFIALPMMRAALEQILEWTPEAIVDYNDRLTKPLVNYLEANHCQMEESAYRSKHITGFRLPKGFSTEELQTHLQSRNISVSLRGTAVRVSTHLFNDTNDVQALMDALDQLFRLS